MAQSDRIGAVLDDAQLAEVKQAIGVLRAKLVPVLKTLTVQDRRELPKLGDKTMAFVQKSYDYSGIHSDLVPGYLDREAFRIDLETLRVLQGLERELAPVNEALGDSIMLSGSEAYQAALVFHNNVRTAKKINLGSSAAVYDDLSARFPGAPVKKS